MKSLIHFAHANGLPTATYDVLLTKLAAHYRVSQIPLIGHDAMYPVTNNWTHLKKQLIHSIEKQANEPLIGVGHSLGGALTLMAVLERPDLFKAVIMLDVPTFSHLESLVVRAAKATGFIDNITPANKSKTRRTQWPGREQAIEYFRSRRMFSNFHDQCLLDYIDSALEENDQGSLDLAYKLDVEMAVYRTIPHTLVLNRSMLRVPMGVLVGKQTDTVRKNQYLRMKNKLGFSGKRITGTHMFPLEYPVETATNIRELLHRMGIS